MGWLDGLFRARPPLKGLDFAGEKVDLPPEDCPPGQALDFGALCALMWLDLQAKEDEVEPVYRKAVEAYRNKWGTE